MWTLPICRESDPSLVWLLQTHEHPFPKTFGSLHVLSPLTTLHLPPAPQCYSPCSFLPFQRLTANQQIHHLLAWCQVSIQSGNTGKGGKSASVPQQTSFLSSLPSGKRSQQDPQGRQGGGLSASIMKFWQAGDPAGDAMNASTPLPCINPQGPIPASAFTRTPFTHGHVLPKKEKSE